MASGCSPEGERSSDFPIMKNHANTRPTLQRRTENPPRPTRPRAGQEEPRHSPQGNGGRLYTDFLALAFYPGMPPRRTDTAA